MKQFIDEVRKAGLNDYEAKSYLYLLKAGPSKVSDLALVAAIPRARIYDVLASLESKGMVVKNSAKPLTYSALTPKEAFSNLSEHKKKTLHSHLDEINSICSFVEKQLDYGKGKETAEDAESFMLSDRSNIYSKIVSEAQKSSKVIFCGDDRQGIERKKAGLSEKLKGKGIKASYIANESLPRCVLFGKESVLLFLTKADSEERDEKAVFIKSEPLARSFYGFIRKD